MSRFPIVVLVALTVAGCDVFSSGPSGVLIEEVQLERLDFSQRWDAPGDLPDIYVDVFAGGGGGFLPVPDGRSDVRENVDEDALPLGFRMPEPVRVDFGQGVGITVNDRDGLSPDDPMFVTDSFTFEDVPEAEVGVRGGRVFDTAEGRIVVVFRWD